MRSIFMWLYAVFFYEEDDGSTSIFLCGFLGFLWFLQVFLCESYKCCIKENKRKCKTDEEEGVH